jgi:hypothetical protein
MELVQCSDIIALLEGCDYLMVPDYVLDNLRSLLFSGKIEILPEDVTKIENLPRFRNIFPCKYLSSGQICDGSFFGAAKFNHIGCLKNVHTLGFDEIVNLSDDNNKDEINRALIGASMGGFAECLEFLVLRCNARLTKQSFHLVAKSGDLNSLRFMQTHFAYNGNPRMFEGENNPCIFAALGGHIGSLDLLKRFNYPWTSAVATAGVKHLHVLQHLVENGCPFSIETLHATIQFDKEDGFKYLMSKSHELDLDPLLHTAASMGRLGIVRLLVDKNCIITPSVFLDLCRTWEGLEYGYNKVRALNERWPESYDPIDSAFGNDRCVEFLVNKAGAKVRRHHVTNAVKYGFLSHLLIFEGKVSFVLDDVYVAIQNEQMECLSFLVDKCGVRLTDRVYEKIKKNSRRKREFIDYLFARHPLNEQLDDSIFEDNEAEFYEFGITK